MCWIVKFHQSQRSKLTQLNSKAVIRNCGIIFFAKFVNSIPCSSSGRNFSMHTGYNPEPNTKGRRFMKLRVINQTVVLVFWSERPGRAVFWSQTAGQAIRLFSSINGLIEKTQFYQLRKVVIYYVLYIGFLHLNYICHPAVQYCCFWNNWNIVDIFRQTPPFPSKPLGVLFSS